VGAETPGGDARVALPRFFHENLKQALAVGGRSAAREARSRAAARIRDQGELRDDEQSALHVFH